MQEIKSQGNQQERFHGDGARPALTIVSSCYLPADNPDQHRDHYSPTIFQGVGFSEGRLSPPPPPRCQLVNVGFTILFRPPHRPSGPQTATDRRAHQAIVSPALWRLRPANDSTVLRRARDRAWGSSSPGSRSASGRWFWLMISEIYPPD